MTRENALLIQPTRLPLTVKGASSSPRTNACGEPHGAGGSAKRDGIANVVYLRASDRPAETQRQEHKLCDAITRCLEEARAVDTRRYEAATVDKIRQEHVPEIDRIVAASRHVLGTVTEYYDATAPSGVRGSLDPTSGDDDLALHVERLVQDTSVTAQLADLAVIARMELAQRRNRLDHMPADANAWDYIEVTSGLRRRVLTTLTAVQRSLCTHRGVESGNSGSPAVFLGVNHAQMASDGPLSPMR